MRLQSERSAPGAPISWTATIACPGCGRPWTLPCEAGQDEIHAGAAAQLRFDLLRACQPCLEHPAPPRQGLDRARRAGARIHRAVCGRGHG